MHGVRDLLLIAILLAGCQKAKSEMANMPAEGGPLDSADQPTIACLLH